MSQQPRRQQAKRNPGRPREDEPPDLGIAHDLTLPKIARLRCPDGKKQAFLRDSECKGLRVRVTAAGVKSFVFERWVNDATMRITIGPAPDVGIKEARAAADILRGQVSSGRDPRVVKREREKADAAQRAADRAELAKATLTVREAWDAYVAERSAATSAGKPVWGPLHRRDHERMTRAGGVRASRGTRGRGVTIDGPLHELMALPLRELTPARVLEWATKESRARPTTAKTAWRLLRTFIRWCGEHDEYASAIPDANTSGKGFSDVREAIGKDNTKDDVLQREQLAAWFAAVRGLSNATAAAYLQTVLLTGARPGEVQGMRWGDVDLTWNTLKLRGKNGERIIPLTPYVAHLLEALPQVNDFVFATPSDDERLSDKPMSMPHQPHEGACAAAGISGLTLHGLRRTFATLTDDTEAAAPAGVAAQIQGHAPSGTREKHYKVRAVGMLRPWHERIEAWFLEQAGVGDWKKDAELPAVDDAAQPRKLRRVK